jgi:hypothetical protein
VASIVARFGVIYRNATVNTIVKPLLAVCLLDTTPADVTATDGNTLTVVMNASGLVHADGGDDGLRGGMVTGPRPNSERERAITPADRRSRPSHRPQYTATSWVVQ